MERLLGPVYRIPSTRRVTIGYLVIGTKRGGSTSLAEWVSRHPHVAPCRSGKGTHYFDTNYHRGAAWYASRFEKASDRWRTTGESSPYYMYHPAAPERIAAILPNVKLIAVLRDPVERAWSQYQYEVARGYETETFERALDLEPSRIKGERERLIADTTYEGFAYRHHGYLERGHYADQLEQIYRFFPPEQVLLVQSERMFADPNAELARVWAFLDLEPIRLDGVDPRNAAKDPQELEPASADRLWAYYRPLNERLYAQPGVDFRWDRRERGDGSGEGD